MSGKVMRYNIHHHWLKLLQRWIGEALHAVALWERGSHRAQACTASLVRRGVPQLQDQGHRPRTMENVAAAFCERHQLRPAPDAAVAEILLSPVRTRDYFENLFIRGPFLPHKM